jgi:hypothetical protein
MGFRDHVPRVQQQEALKPVRPPKGHYFFAGQTFPRITWYKDKNLRKLYFYIVVLILTNTANGKLFGEDVCSMKSSIANTDYNLGFDGSMMNGLQTLSYWREYFDHPQGSKLGLFNASMSLGSMLGLFFVPYTGEYFLIRLFHLLVFALHLLLQK